MQPPCAETCGHRVRTEQRTEVRWKTEAAVLEGELKGECGPHLTQSLVKCGTCSHFTKVRFMQNMQYQSEYIFNRCLKETYCSGNCIYQIHGNGYVSSLLTRTQSMYEIKKVLNMTSH